MSVAMERSPSLFVRDSSSEQPPGPPLRPAQDRRARHLHHHHHHHHSSRQPNTLRHHHHHHHHHHSRTNARQPARQQHQQAGSASFIDLTEEDDLVEISRSQQQQSTSQSSQASYNPRRTSQRATTPPRLARSDGTLSRVNMPELIDLTGDSPEAEQPRPRQRNSIALPRHPDDRLPAQIPDHQNPPHDALFRVNFGQHLGSFNLGNIINPRGGIGAVFNRLGQLYDIDVTRAAQNRPEPERDTPKVVLAPIPPTRSGFTRNTCAEDGDINICPCCEEELAYDRNYSAPDSSGGRKRKRAAGEHHFWAVKECGHVYCSGCFSNRMPTKASPRGAGFTVVAPKDIRCVVDDCNSKVAAKGAWTGLFASG